MTTFARDTSDDTAKSAERTLADDTSAARQRVLALFLPVAPQHGIGAPFPRKVVDRIVT